MKLLERFLFLSIFVVFCSVIFSLLLTKNLKPSFLFAQERPMASTPVAQEQKEADMEFSVEDQELIMFNYRGKDSGGERIKSYFILFSSGNIVYWRYHGRGAYLYNYRSDTWMYANFASKEKSLVKHFYFSLQEKNLKFDKTYNKKSCSELQLFDPYWESFYDTCFITLTEAINIFGDDTVKNFQEKHLSWSSLEPIKNLSGFQNFLKNKVVFMHRWFYFTNRQFNRNLDLHSIKHYERLSKVRKNLGLKVPHLHLFEHSKSLPTCKAFMC